MRVCSSILLIASIGLAPGSGLAQDNLPAAPSATREQRKPQSPPAADTAKTDNSTQQEQSNVAPKPADVSAASRTSPAPTADEDAATTIRVPVNEVNVIFTVTDKHGRYVKNLKKSDFNVVDDSKPAAEIRSFHNETDLPLQVGLLVDASNSVRDRFKFEQESAIEFLNQTVRPRYDRAFVVGFDVTPEVTQDFTDNTEALSRGVRALKPGGGTAMYDALYFACRDKLLKAQRGGPTRRAIILLSDGDDNQSHVTREESMDMAQRAAGSQPPRLLRTRAIAWLVIPVLRFRRNLGLNRTIAPLFSICRRRSKPNCTMPSARVTSLKMAGSTSP